MPIPALPGGPIDPALNPALTTPEQLKTQREYFDALLKGSEGGIPVGKSGSWEAVSPWGGAAQMAKALAGGLGLHSVTQQQIAQSEQSAGKEMTGAQRPYAPQPYAPIGPTPPNPNEAVGPQSSAQGPTATASAGGDAIDQYSQMIKQRESGGNYRAIGPQITNPQSAYYGDHAYGAHQVMGRNIPEWTKQAFGRPMSIAEYVNSPAAQEQLFRQRFGQYIAQTGSPRDAASMWFSGKPFSQGQYKSDYQPGQAGGTTGAKYAGGFPATQAGGQQPAPVRVASTAPYAPTAPGAMSGALQGQGPATPTTPAEPGTTAPTQVAGGPAVHGGGYQTEQPVQPGMARGGQAAPAGVIPGRPHMDPAHIRAILADPNIDHEFKIWAWQQYQNEYQPIPYTTHYGMQGAYYPGMGPGGSGPPGQSTLIAPPPEWKQNEIGPIHTWKPYYQTVPGMPPPPTTQKGIPQPVGAPPPGPAAPAPVAPTEEGGGTGERGEAPSKVQVASLEPTAGTMTDAPSMLGTKPPAITPTKEAPASAGPVLAQAPKSLDEMSDEELYKWNQGQEIYKRGAEEGVSKAADSAQKYYDTVTDRGNSAAESSSQLKEMENIVNAPNFYSGIGSPWVLAAKRLIAVAGGDPNSAAAMETFEKMRNSLNLSGLREQLGGLGQIRLAEINMINSAFANLDNSVAANKALIYIAQRINDRVQAAGQMADKFRMENGGVPDLSLKNKLAQFYKDKPLMTDQQVQDFQKMITTESGAKAGATTGPKNYGPEPPAGSKPRFMAPGTTSPVQGTP